MFPSLGPSCWLVLATQTCVRHTLLTLELLSTNADILNAEGWSTEARKRVRYPIFQYLRSRPSRDGDDDESGKDDEDRIRTVSYCVRV